MSSSGPTFAYDVLEYPSYSFSQTHPDLLGTLGELFGLTPPPANRCRVLELGCATATNILALAAAYPESQFVGIDFSARQIEHAKKRLEGLGFSNVDIRHASILDIDESYGQFDYILCHGVYSWVPVPVQQGILDVCAKRLAPDGIGYISYNTLPGWHMRGMIREMMCYHDTWHQKEPPLQRVGQARALLQFLGNASRGQNNPYAHLLRQELELIQKVPDGYIFHEHLEEHNDPIYFFEFNERLVAQGLRFLGEADFRSMVHENLPPEVRQQLTSVAPNLVQMEQYLDFLSNRMFRQSLVCRESHRPDYSIGPERIYNWRFASPAKPASKAVDFALGKGETFTLVSGLTISADDPCMKAALVALSEVWPNALAFDQLFDQVTHRLEKRPTTDSETATLRQTLGSALLRLYSAGGTTLLEFWRSYPSFVTRVSERPIAGPMARMMALEGSQVTNLRHQPVTIGDFDRHLLPALDGSQTRTTLRSRLLEAFRTGKINLARNGQPIREEHQARSVLTATIDEQLQKYASNAILIG